MRYEFGRYSLDASRYLFTIDDVIHPLEPQVFDLLLLLLENAGALVSHDDLIERVWGGRIVSDASISARISAARSAIGDSGTEQAWIKTVARRGFRFVGEVQRVAGESDRRDSIDTMSRQDIGFCFSKDGTRLAYARSGSGPPLVRAGHWLTHLEHDWVSPVWRPILDEFGKSFTLWRFDKRGNGLSEREPKDLSLDASIDDLEAVVDAAGLENFALYGTSQGAPIAIGYALRHPQKVSHLILQGGYEAGRLARGLSTDTELSQALVTMIREGWGRHGSAFLRAFTAVFIPDGTADQIASLADMQRLSASVDMAVRLREAADRYSVAGRLQDVAVPTLVFHARDDAVHALEQGLALAAGIPRAKFVQLDSANHVILPQEPAWKTLYDEIRQFVLPSR